MESCLLCLSLCLFVGKAAERWHHELYCAACCVLCTVCCVDSVEMRECRKCGRRFNMQAHARHVKKNLCQPKKRRVFDMSKKRVEGAPTGGGGGGGGGGRGGKSGKAKKKAVPGAMPKWKRDRQALREVTHPSTHPHPLPFLPAPYPPA